ncbi:HEAT repeat domain-containing protein [Pontiella sp.]|uniref:HEAT repeat domain-containing protein n=1 Tax=Pontiella sp. TaxID=2837462 RepID=UPI003561920F
MSRKIIILLLLGLGALSASLLIRPGDDRDRVDDEPAPVEAVVEDAPAVAKWAAADGDGPATAVVDSGASAANAAKQAALNSMRDLLDEGHDLQALEAARQLVKHEDPGIRLEALLAMQWIGGPAVYDITSFFDDPDEEIRSYAEQVFDEALDELEDPGLKAAVLAGNLESALPAVRYVAVEDLVFLPDHLSFKPLASALNDHHEEVRELARDNLEFIAEEVFQTEAEALAWFGEHEEELKALSESF